MMAKNTDVDNRLKFQPKGILIGQKCFHFKDLYIQLRRIFNIQFMIEWRNLMSIMLFYMIVFPFIASFFDENIANHHHNHHINPTTKISVITMASKIHSWPSQLTTPNQITLYINDNTSIHFIFLRMKHYETLHYCYYCHN